MIAASVLGLGVVAVMALILALTARIEQLLAGPASRDEVPPENVP
jgi:hypothetical protein